jgi:uncharacterized protein YdeI (YjbR/CyaY-like superfamily)
MDEQPRRRLSPRRAPQPDDGEAARSRTNTGTLDPRKIPFCHALLDAVIDTNVDDYLRDGCGRCAHYKTPSCKVHRWAAELRSLRALLLASDLEEAVKWGSPCYEVDGKNVAMLISFKDSCVLSFFQGALLEDPDGALEAAGPNSRHARLLRFHSPEDVARRETVTERLLRQAIEVARSGKRVPRALDEERLPTELERRLAADPALRAAFDGLTPGRRRSHALHVSGAKQSETRERRVDRCAADILAGRGWGER